MELFKPKTENQNTILSREQMKQITGGFVAPVTCYWSWDPIDMSASLPCNDSPDYCQGYADYMCERDPDCTDVDCR